MEHVSRTHFIICSSVLFLHKRLTFRAIVKYVDEIPNVRFMKVVFSRATHRA